MSPDELAAIKDRCSKATPGPWKLWGMSVLADPVGDSNLDTAIHVANTAFRDANGRPRTNDADFIAAARTDVPNLLDEVERLTRIVNGYDRVEQRAVKAEAELARNERIESEACDICGWVRDPAQHAAWHERAGDAVTIEPDVSGFVDPGAVNGPGMAHGDTPQADDAGEGQS